MANLPLPKLNEVYYFECKMYEKPEGTDVAIGLATKPYPSFRLPGESVWGVCLGRGREVGIRAERREGERNRRARELTFSSPSFFARLEQILSSLPIRRFQIPQLPLHLHLARSSSRRRRRPRCRLPSSNRNRLLHPQRSKTRRRLRRSATFQPLPYHRSFRTSNHSRQPWTVWVRVHRGEREEVGVGAEYWDVGSSACVWE